VSPEGQALAPSGPSKAAMDPSAPGVGISGEGSGASGLNVASKGQQQDDATAQPVEKRRIVQIMVAVGISERAHKGSTVEDLVAGDQEDGSCLLALIAFARFDDCRNRQMTIPLTYLDTPIGVAQEFADSNSISPLDVDLVAGGIADVFRKLSVWSAKIEAALIKAQKRKEEEGLSEPAESLVKLEEIWDGDIEVTKCRSFEKREELCRNSLYTKLYT
jgi:hypothetical protein